MICCSEDIGLLPTPQKLLLHGFLKLAKKNYLSIKEVFEKPPAIKKY